MAFIEGAELKIGSDADGETPSDETPRHDVTVQSFCLDITEVTVKAYSECEACERPRMTVESEGITPNGRSFWSQFCNGPGAPETQNHPINCIDWYQATAYCATLGRRLPTEAEWELSARGKDARTYPWGPLPPSGERLNACGSECSRMLTERLEAVGKGGWPRMYGDDDSAPATAAVGRYPAGASPAGVLDLAGNVWEWTESHYCPYDKDDCGDSRRVLRGGGWDTVESQQVRAARRLPSAPTARGWSIGFRCAKTP
jgi:formylglycine-generating enzyme required for sulfatase activity